jgi:hypothetical protein
MKSVDCLRRLLMMSKVDETEALAPALFIDLQNCGGNNSKLREEMDEIVLSDLKVKVLDIEVGELRTHLLKLGLTFLVRVNR